MPDVVESRKQAAVKTQNVKTEPANTNGEGETAQNCGKYFVLFSWRIFFHSTCIYRYFRENKYIMAFTIFQVYQYFTIYRQYFFFIII